MKIEYQITKQDFLAFQLFFTSQSKQVKKIKLRSTIMLFAFFFIAAIFCYIRVNLFSTVYFLVFAILSIFIFPPLYKRKLKKDLIKFCEENYKNIGDEKTFLEFENESIYSKSKMGESRLNVSEIEKIDETELYFFIKLSNALTLIIPKSEIENVDVLRTKLKSYEIEFNSLLDWKW